MDEPSFVEIVNVTLELVNDIDALRLRYWLGWLWSTLPTYVEAVCWRPWCDEHERAVVVSRQVLSPDEARFYPLRVAHVANEMRCCPFGLTAHRNEHQPLDEGDLVAGLCAIVARAIPRYAEWSTNRQQWRIRRAVQQLLTCERSNRYEDTYARQLRRSIARLALFRCIQELPFVGVLRAITNIQPDGSLEYPERLPLGWRAALAHYGLELPVVYQLLYAAELPYCDGREWAKEMRRAHQYANPLHTALTMLKVLQDLVGALDMHSRVWVLESLQGVV